MTASAQYRRQRILGEVLARRNASVLDLAKSLQVSEATVRRDLKILSDEGQVDLVYGGATIRRDSDYSFRSKQQRNIAEKQIIGRLAAELVREDGQVFLDSGTTCFEMVPFLKRKRGISIIANSARLALELDGPNSSVILIGGQYRPDRMDNVGPLAATTMEQLRGYQCFIGADGMSADFGPSAADVESAHFNRLAVLNSRETILVVDHTKFNAPSLFKIVDWDRIRRIVTDKQPDAAWMSFFEVRGINLVMPLTSEAVKTHEEASSSG